MPGSYIYGRKMQNRLLYNLGMGFYRSLLFLAGPFHPKAKKMLAGRKESSIRIQNWRKDNPQKEVFWFHAASVGEFEQALPVIRLLKEKHPEAGIAVSFFSPSGMELKGNHSLIDLSFYLPADLPDAMQKLVKILNPSAVILVKYEFWYNLLRACRTSGVPVISICCILRESALKNPFLKLHLRKTLPLFQFLFIQNSETARILKGFHQENFQIIGDTRVDRVLEIREQQTEIDWIPAWKDGHKLLIAGSAWAEDLVFLREFIQHSVVETDGLWRVLIVPHEIDEAGIQHLSSALPLPYQLFSEWKETQEDCDILILDSLGLLSRTYRYADAAWIGGGFKTGLHNTLEAAVYGIPVGFGPKFRKFREATDLQEIGVAKSFPEGGPVWEFFQKSTELEEEKIRIRQAAENYFQSQKGASEAIVSCLSALPGENKKS